MATAYLPSSDALLSYDTVDTVSSDLDIIVSPLAAYTHANNHPIEECIELDLPSSSPPTISAYTSSKTLEQAQSASSLPLYNLKTSSKPAENHETGQLDLGLAQDLDSPVSLYHLPTSPYTLSSPSFQGDIPLFASKSRHSHPTEPYSTSRPIVEGYSGPSYPLEPPSVNSAPAELRAYATNPTMSPAPCSHGITLHSTSYHLAPQATYHSYDGLLPSIVPVSSSQVPAPQTWAETRPKDPIIPEIDDVVVWQHVRDSRGIRRNHLIPLDHLNGFSPSVPDLNASWELIFYAPGTDALNGAATDADFSAEQHLPSHPPVLFDDRDILPYSSTCPAAEQPTPLQILPLDPDFLVNTPEKKSKVKQQAVPPTPPSPPTPPRASRLRFSFYPTSATAVEVSSTSGFTSNSTSISTSSLEVSIDDTPENYDTSNIPVHRTDSPASQPHKAKRKISQPKLSMAMARMEDDAESYHPSEDENESIPYEEIPLGDLNQVQEATEAGIEILQISLKEKKKRKVSTKHKRRNQIVEARDGDLKGKATKCKEEAFNVLTHNTLTGEFRNRQANLLFPERIF